MQMKKIKITNVKSSKYAYIPVIVAAGQKPYGFFRVAESIARVFNSQLLELHGKLKYWEYLSLFLKRPDYIISVGTLSPKKLMLLGTCPRRVIAYIAVEGPFPIPKTLKWLVNNTGRVIIVAPSYYVRKELSLSGLKVFGVIPHGIDLNECLATNIKLGFLPRKFRVLTVTASFQYRKSLGIRYLFRAWSKLPPSIRKNAIIIAKVPRGSARYVLQIASSEGIKSEECLILDAYLTHKEMFALYRSSDLYVHPTLSDGFGLPILESLACGTPVVVMNAGPWNEIATKDVGWFVKVSKEIIAYEGGLPYRLKIPDIDDLSNKLAESIKCYHENRDDLRRKCVERAQVFDAHKVYGKFKRLIELIEQW
jgi:glycosyltransferase involved in cell wall biosynthesis